MTTIKTTIKQLILNRLSGDDTIQMYSLLAAKGITDYKGKNSIVRLTDRLVLSLSPTYHSDTVTLRCRGNRRLWDKLAHRVNADRHYRFSSELSNNTSPILLKKVVFTKPQAVRAIAVLLKHYGHK